MAREFDILDKFVTHEESEYQKGLPEAKEQQALLTDELNQRGVIGLVVGSLPDGWQWGIENPRFDEGVWDISSRVVAYRDHASVKGVSIRDVKLVTVIFDQSKVLTVTGQKTTFSGPIPQGRDEFIGKVKPALDEAFSNSERELKHINFISDLIHNPRPDPQVLHG